MADIVGFLENGTFFCLRGEHNLTEMDISCANQTFPQHDTLIHPYKEFPHIFADLNGDLSSELVFALESDDSKTPRFETWKLRDLVKNK